MAPTVVGSGLMFPKPEKRKKRNRNGGTQGRFRARVLKADGGKCMDKLCECHKESRRDRLLNWLEAHHIIYRSHITGPKRNRVGNGITLCDVAHHKAHHGYGSGATRVTALEYMIRVIEQHLGASYFRWTKTLRELKKKRGA